MLSGCAGQPGMLTIGRPAFELPVPAEVVGAAPIAPVGLFFIAGMPP